MRLLYLCFFIIGLNFQTFFIEQELINIHKHNAVLVLIPLYWVFGDYKLLKAVRYVRQRT